MCTEQLGNKHLLHTNAMDQTLACIRIKMKFKLIYFYTENLIKVFDTLVLFRKQEYDRILLYEKVVYSFVYI